eukprot:5569844-Pyramimonas_sp.AAC.1
MSPGWHDSIASPSGRNGGDMDWPRLQAPAWAKTEGKAAKWGPASGGGSGIAGLPPGMGPAKEELVGRGAAPIAAIAGIAGIAGHCSAAKDSG